MTHSELINRAEKWLRGSLDCRVVLTEFKAYTYSGETPDAIGWKESHCILVEVKTSKSDFMADQKKRSRRKGFPAMGNYRFYFAEKGVLDGCEIPEGWGLYEVCGRTVRHNRGVSYKSFGQKLNESCKQSEIAMLVSALVRGRKKDCIRTLYGS